jgi:beta-glucanase (GH16 family)
MHKKLVFQEIFSTPNLDEDVWNLEVGEKWANNESQCYVNHSKNLVLTPGNLRLIADINPLEERCRYQSIRMNTKGKKEFKYGTFIVRARLPKGLGSWPAIWFLPHDIGQVRWPKCGEIDLMETVGKDPGVIHFSLHTETLNHRLGTHRTYFKSIPNITEGFHDYKMIWTEQAISFYVDDQHYVTFEAGDKSEATWPFDKPYYLIINIAVGGFWGGTIVEEDMPYIMDIAKVEVYQ